MRRSEFCFDNETPAHRNGCILDALASRLVRNRDWVELHPGQRLSDLVAVDVRWLGDGARERLDGTALLA